MTTDEEYAECWRTGQPMPDLLCASCGEPYSRGCRKTHAHEGYCIDIGDIRALWCGCYAHKECEKSGNCCREHGARGHDD